MKRDSDEMDVVEGAADAGGSGDVEPTAKKLRNKEPELPIMDVVEEPNASERTLLSVFKKFIGSGQHTLVEREPNPGGYSLLNPDYVGKRDHHILTDLESNVEQASKFVLANMGNRVDQIGLQMKYLHDNLRKVFEDTMMNNDLHMAACNFVKKPGHTYHLYERPSAQKYFSMLSPDDWSGNSPHKFLGSWYLESDQSWTPAEERHLRYEGVNFIRKLYATKSLQ